MGSFFGAAWNIWFHLQFQGSSSSDLTKMLAKGTFSMGSLAEFRTPGKFEKRVPSYVWPIHDIVYSYINYIHWYAYVRAYLYGVYIYIYYVETCLCFFFFRVGCYSTYGSHSTLAPAPLPSSVTYFVSTSINPSVSRSICISHCHTIRLSHYPHLYLRLDFLFTIFTSLSNIYVCN